MALKALFNNIFILKIWAACPYVGMLSVSSDRKVYKWSPEKLHLKSTIKCLKEVKIDKWPDLSS